MVHRDNRLRCIPDAINIRVFYSFEKALLHCHVTLLSILIL